MRHRLSIAACWVALLVSAACYDNPISSSDSPASIQFAARSASQCDTRSAPVRDYFTLKADQQTIGELFRALSAACTDGNRAAALQNGFAILEIVEVAREAKNTGQPSAGAQVVAVAWNVMQPFVCPASLSNCYAPTLPAQGLSLENLASALDVQGAFGIRSSGDEPVISYGNASASLPLPYWGVAPLAGSSWDQVLPDGRALIVGFPNYTASSGLNEQAFGSAVAYDWTVLPWYSPPDETKALSVTVCVTQGASNTQKHKVAHGGALLEDAQDSWCDNFTDPLVAATLRSRFESLASVLVPLWPQRLEAMITGSSGSGKAREFSPFFAYDVELEGASAFITQPGTARVNGLICASTESPSPGANECSTGIRVQLNTKNGSPLFGAANVLLVMTAEDNNGSWTLMGSRTGTRVTDASELVYEWKDLRIDKAGAYKLHVYRTGADGCVYDDGGTRVGESCANSIGLAFPAISSNKFLVNP